jgi:hypothetical protein
MVRGVALIACVLGVSTAAAATPPRLTLVARAPLTLRGTHFRPLERIRVTVYTPARPIRTVRATVAGSFSVMFTGVYAGRCASLRAVAVGAAGSTASLKLLPLPGCISA